MPSPRTRKLTIVAQDPTIRMANNKILTAEVSIPAEDLESGPTGHRVRIRDAVAATGRLFTSRKWTLQNAAEYKRPSNTTIRSDPRFHQQNVFGIVMRTLSRFERALGRRVSWATFGHQLKVLPHAFAKLEAWYTRSDSMVEEQAGGLFLGYEASTLQHKTVYINDSPTSYISTSIEPMYV
jgi:hypothetical protein